MGTLHIGENELPLTVDPDPVALPPLSAVDAMLAEQVALGLSPGEHIMTHYRAELRRRGILGSAELAAQPHGARVRVAGLLVVHQSPPTAKGFHFLTLEDEDGMMNVIVRPGVYDQHRRVIHGKLLLLVKGTVQREGEAMNLLAERVYPLAQLA